jgi:antitoxin ParD1/3/4
VLSQADQSCFYNSAERLVAIGGWAEDSEGARGYQRLTTFVIWAKVKAETEGIAMNVSLTPELEQFVSTKVDSGRYNSASEVVREALRLLEEHDQARASQVTEFNRELGRRLASLDRGEKVDPAESRAKLRRKSQERRK